MELQLEVILDRHPDEKDRGKIEHIDNTDLITLCTQQRNIRHSKGFKKIQRVTAYCDMLWGKNP